MTGVTVLTPSYGYARYIVDTVRSVHGQLEGSARHVVQDGASVDGTMQVLKKYSWLDAASTPDRGQSDALNRAFSKADDEWIGWLNADEFYLPEGLRVLVDASREGDVVFGDSIFVDERGRFLRLVPQHPMHSFVLRNYGPFVSSCAAIFRRSVLGDLPWDIDVNRVMDWDLYLRLQQRGARFVYVPYPVGAFRVHSERITARPAEEHAASYALLQQRYGLRRSGLMQAAGHAAHGVLKLCHGGYLRQRRTQSFVGADMRWFADEHACRAVQALLRVAARRTVGSRREAVAIRVVQDDSR